MSPWESQAPEYWMAYPFHLWQAMLPPFVSQHLLTPIHGECRDKVQVTDPLPGALKAAMDEPSDGFSRPPPPPAPCPPIPNLTEQGKDANKTM